MQTLNTPRCKNWHSYVLKRISHRTALSINRNNRPKNPCVHFKQRLQVLHQHNVKHVQPVSGVGIQTRDLLNASLILKPPDKGSHPLPQTNLPLFFSFVLDVDIIPDSSINTNKTFFAWAVVVAQLVERSLLIPEVCGSNPVIRKKNLY